MWKAKTLAEKRKQAMARQGEGQNEDAASASGGGKAASGGGKAGGRGGKGGKSGRGVKCVKNSVWASQCVGFSAHV